MASSRFWLFSTSSPPPYSAAAFVLCALFLLTVAPDSWPIHAESPLAYAPATDSDTEVKRPTEVAWSRAIELIPKEYRKRYQKWKSEYLLTESGREAWKQYALNPNFTLTVTISKEEGHGARIDGYQWDTSGRLIAATIILGHKLDSGYPSSINYPITCSLAPDNLPSEVKGQILAATKLAHEFGHLDQMLSINGSLYQLQNDLMIEYNCIFFANGYNVHDPRLVELSQRMSGTPVSIAQDREHWAEMGALLYLQERLPGLTNRAKLPGPIKEAIQMYYSTYPERLHFAN